MHDFQRYAGVMRHVAGNTSLSLAVLMMQPGLLQKCLPSALVVIALVNRQHGSLPPALQVCLHRLVAVHVRLCVSTRPTVMFAWLWCLSCWLLYYRGSSCLHKV